MTLTNVCANFKYFSLHCILNKDDCAVCELIQTDSFHYNIIFSHWDMLSIQYNRGKGVRGQLHHVPFLREKIFSLLQVNMTS